MNVIVFGAMGTGGRGRVLHFILHMRRAGHVIARPLNCGVMPTLGHGGIADVQ
jgi:hypothetical protein